MEDAHPCLSCGEITEHKSQVCNRCSDPDVFERSSAGSQGPFTTIAGECDYNYSEDALGPHTSDERWSWEYVEDKDI